MKLTVLYDERCGLCRSCRDWLRARETLIPVDFLALQSPVVDERFPGIRRFRLERFLIAVDDRGGVYQGERAWVACLSALKEYRTLARGLSHPALRPVLRATCGLVSKHRHRISRWLGMECEGSCHV